MSSMEVCDNCGIGYRMSFHDLPYEPADMDLCPKCRELPLGSLRRRVPRSDDEKPRIRVKAGSSPCV